MRMYPPLFNVAKLAEHVCEQYSSLGARLSGVVHLSDPRKPTVLKLNDDEKEALKGLSDKEKVKFLNKLCAEAQKKAEEVYVAPVEDDSDEE